MRRAFAIAVAALVAFLVSDARGALGPAQWSRPTDANQNWLGNLPPPSAAPDPTTAPVRPIDLNPVGAPCILQAPGANGLPVCASPLTGISVNDPISSTGGATPTLGLKFDNSTITLNGGGAVQVGAFTGAIVKAAGATSTTFGVGAGTSLLGVSGSAAARADIVATANNQVAQMLGGVVQFHALDYNQLTGTPAAITSLLGDVLGTGPGATTATIQPHVVTFNKFQQVTGPAVLGVATAGLANVAALTSSSSNDVLWNNAGTVGFGALPYSAISGTPTLHYQTVIGLPQEPALDVGTASATGLSANDNAGVSTRFFNTLVTGLAGGQTVVGGTNAGDRLTLLSNNLPQTGANIGLIMLGASGRSYIIPDVTSSFGAQLTLNNFLTIYGGVSNNGSNAGINIGGSGGPPSTAPINVNVSHNNGQYIQIVNTSAGTSAFAALSVGNGSGNAGSLSMTGTAFSTGIPLAPAGTVVLASSGISTSSAGPNLLIDSGNNANSGDIILATGDLERWRVTFNGALQGIERSTPATPGAGFGKIWFDSTIHGGLFAVNSSGAVTHTVKTVAAAGGTCLTGIHDDGTVDTGSCVGSASLGDPGANGIVVRTALNTTTAGQLSGPVTTSGTSLATSINLGAGGISGTLALGNEGAPTSTGFAHVTSGAWDSAARAIDLSGADVTNQLKAASFPILTGPVTTPGGSLATSLNVGAIGITGLLPLANQAAPTGTGFAHGTSGVWDSAFRAVDLSGADATGVIAAARYGSFTNDEPIFWNGGLAQDSAFKWDHTNHRLGIGTTPSNPLHVIGRAQFGDGTIASDVLTIGTTSYGGGISMWKDATPSAAMAASLSVPGTAATSDLVVSAFNGGGWAETARFPNAGGLRVANLSAGGITKATASTGQFAIASASDVSTALGTGSSTGIVEVSAGTYSSYTTTANRVLLGTAGGGVTDSANLTFSAGNLSVSNTVKFGGLSASSLVATDSGDFGTSVTVDAPLSYSGGHLSIPGTPSHVFHYQHFIGQGSSSLTEWLFPGGGDDTASNDQIEYPAAMSAGHLTWYIFVLRNGISSGTLTFTPTLNGSPMSGAAFNVTSSTTLGGYTVVSNFATGSSSATDTFGLKYSGTFTEGSAGGGRFLMTLVYTP